MCKQACSYVFVQTVCLLTVQPVQGFEVDRFAQSKQNYIQSNVQLVHVCDKIDWAPFLITLFCVCEGNLGTRHHTSDVM